MLVTYVGLFAAPDGSSDLRANCKDTGFVASYGVGLLLGHMVLLDLFALVGEPVVSLCSELAASWTLFLGQKVDQHYNRLQLMTFPDCFVILLVLS